MTTDNTTPYDIVLMTFNARYIHSAFGLRYLRANLGELRPHSIIVEVDINRRIIDVAEYILAYQPKIIGLSVYIWNAVQSLHLVELLKQIQPDLKIVLGGPEVSYETEQQALTALADHVVVGAGEVAFKQLCTDILFGQHTSPKIISAQSVELNQLALPYQEYTTEDIANRIIYVEASRGCPFRCEFCLSSLDKKVVSFELQWFLDVLQDLYQRGVRQFKFVDRTFNLKITTCKAILNFFLERLPDSLFVHFEVIPDRLPDELKQLIAQFPAGVLQFEIGVQTFNPDVQQIISRRQDNAKTEENIRWLREQSQAHLHTDLIAGLPGEGLSSFANSFDRLLQLNPHEIQVGILKRLRGTPIIRHTENFGMVYGTQPPYEILYNDQIDFATMQRIRRFARYWDLIGNSGNFIAIRQLLGQQASAFSEFMALSDWIYETTGQTHKIALKRLYELVYQGLTSGLLWPATQVETAMRADYQNSSLANKPFFLDKNVQVKSSINRDVTSLAARQARHLQS